MAANFSNSDTFSAAASSSSILSPVFSVAPIPIAITKTTHKKHFPSSSSSSSSSSYPAERDREAVDDNR
jgi:hypothetical protein